MLQSIYTKNEIKKREVICYCRRVESSFVYKFDVQIAIAAISGNKATLLRKKWEMGFQIFFQTNYFSRKNCIKICAVGRITLLDR